MSHDQAENFDDEQLLARLRTGDDEAFRIFLNRYSSALHKLANRRLGADMRRRLEAEDVVQSVFRTFFRRASNGEFQVRDADSLWKLLCVVTVAKVRMKRRFHSQQQRSVAREEHPDTAGFSDAGHSLQVPDSSSTPEEAAELADEFEAIIRELDDEEQNILNLKLEGYTNGEIAERLSCSARTVRRIQSRIQVRLQAWIQNDEVANG